MNYGKAIRLVRAARGLSQKALAERLRVDASFVSHLERGERMPSTETLEALAASLAIPMYLLVFLASEDSERRGIPADQADAFGRALLDILVSMPSHATSKK